MSKFFITNNSGIFQKIQKRVNESEYQTAFEYIRESIFALSTKKLVVNNQNGVLRSNGFAVITGTLAWENGEAVNESTLIKIHNAFRGNVNEIREKAIGNYAAAILKNDCLFVFGEIPGFYNIYSYCVDGTWLISNSLYDMACVMREVLTINKFAVTESTVQDGILLDDTYYNEIHRLSGFNHIKVTHNSFDVIEEELLYPMALGSLDEKVERYSHLSKSYGEKMSAAYGAPAISMTGGLDARMVLSSYLAAGIKPHLYYGTGDSFITNTYSQDKEIDKLFAEKFGLVFHDESWATPTPVNKYWDKYLNQFGFYYDTYAGSDATMESIIQSPCQLFTFGYCGELLRNLPWIESRDKDYFTLDEYINEFYLTKDVLKSVVESDKYFEYIRAKQIKICKYYHLDINHIANEDIFYLSLERRKSADAAMLNFVNFIKFCSYLLGQYENLLAGRVTCEEAKDSGFMLRCLNSLMPEVLDVPVFSHCRMREFFRDTMTLTPQNQNNGLCKNRIKELIRNKCPRIYGIIMQAIKGQNTWRFAKDTDIINIILTLFKKYDSFNLVRSNKIVDKRRLIKYVMKVYAINRVGKK